MSSRQKFDDATESLRDAVGDEVKQYLGDELTTLVPTVIGQTAGAEAPQANCSSKPPVE